MNFTALLLTLISGLFFVCGFLFVKFWKKKKELKLISTSLAFIIMIGMILLDLLPEVIELANSLPYSKVFRIFLILLFLGVGMGLLKIFDLFLPHHHHNHHEHERNTKEHNQHSFHVGFILATSLILHNILEGMSIYLVAYESVSSGVLMAIGVGLHNLPLGIEIASNIEKENSRIKNILFSLLCFSSFIGAFFLFFFQVTLANFLLFVCLCVSGGMILYIALFELLQEMFMYAKEKSTYLGIFIGGILFLLMTILS